MLPTLQRLLCVIFLSAAAAARPFDAGPMLLEPGPTGMTVVVHHATPVAPTLTYHPADRPDEKSTSARGERGTRHAFVLTGLAPDTRYQYRVTAGEWNSGPCTFHTPPADPEKYLMLAAGDLRTQPDRFREVAEAMRKHEPRALCWITTGDFPADGRDYRMWLRHFFIPGRELLSTIPIWPCIGNHERTRTSDGERDPASLYFELFPFAGDRRTDWYRWDYGFHTLLVLDSCSPMQPGSEQYDWLAQQLRSPRRKFTILAFHHAVFTSGPHGRLGDDGEPVEEPIRVARRDWRPLFEKYGVDLVLHGHDHFYERSAYRGVQYVVTGGAGAPLYDFGRAPNPHRAKAEKSHHYCRITITPTRLSLEAVRPDGRVFDSFFIRKPEK